MPGGIASPFGNGKAAPSIIYGGTGDLPWVRPLSSKASIKRAMGAVAVGMLTPFSRSSRPSCARRLSVTQSSIEWSFRS